MLDLSCVMWGLFRKILALVWILGPESTGTRIYISVKNVSMWSQDGERMSNLCLFCCKRDTFTHRSQVGVGRAKVQQGHVQQCAWHVFGPDLLVDSDRVNSLWADLYLCTKEM